MQRLCTVLTRHDLRVRRVLPIVCLPALVAAFIGCSKSEEYVPVSGTVTLNGSPLANAKLIFEPIGNSAGVAPGKPSYGRTDESGRYTLKSFVANQNGAAVGEHRVRIVTVAAVDPTEEQRVAARKRLEREEVSGGGNAAAVTDERVREYLSDTLRQKLQETLPARYHTDTELRIRVDSTGTDRANFDLQNP